MAEILSVLPLAGGNVTPTLGVLSELVARGHRVRIVGHPGLAPELDRAGIAAAFEPVRHARPWNPRSDNPGVRSMLAWLPLASDRGFGRDVEAAIARDRPDVVLVDCMIPGVLGSVRRSGVPAAMLFHTVLPYWDAQWSVQTPMGWWLWATGTHPLRRDRLPDTLLLATDVDLDPLTPGLIPRDRITQTGAIVPDPAPSVPRPADGPIVVSLSTIAYPGQLETLRRIVDTVGDLGARAVVTTGPAVDPAALPKRSGVDVRPYGDHTELLRSAGLLIGHGGHGTTMRALAAGVPVLVVPMSRHADHQLVGAAVSRLGVGGCVPKDATPARLRAEVERLLRDDGVSRRTRDLAVRIRSRMGAVAAAGILEKLGQQGSGADDEAGQGEEQQHQDPRDRR